MKLVRTIARRFLLDKRAESVQRGRGFVSFIAAVSMAGLALGVTALLVVTSVMNGFERELKNALTSYHGHILMYSRGEPISDPEKYIDEIPKLFPGVKAVSPYYFGEAMLSSAKGVVGAIVEGADRATVGKVSAVANKVIAGHLPNAVLPPADESQAPDGTAPQKLPEIALGAELASKLHVGVGDSVVITVPFALKGDAPLVRKLVVAGVIRIGMYEYDSKYSVMDLKDLQQILGIGNRVNALRMLTDDPEQSINITASLNEKYGPYLRAKDWSSLNRNLFYAIRLEKVVIAIILLAIVLVASFNVISTILMMVHDKKRQISMLKALGLKPKSTMLVFLLIGGMMSVLGTVLGVGVGRALCALIAWKSIIDLPADVYFLSRLPVEIRGWEWALISLFTIALAAGSTLVPSYRVSRESPVEGLRYE